MPTIWNTPYPFPLKKICLVASAIFSACALQAQQPPPPPADTTSQETPLAEVQVRENRLETPLSRLTRPTTVLRKSLLAQIPVQSIQEALSQVGGLDVRTRGPLGVQADLGIRGGGFDQTLVLLDGMKLSDPQTGHHSLNLPINLDQVERIEITKTGASRLYGPNAFAGAVNIVSQMPERSGMRLSAYGGQFLDAGGSASLSLVGKNYSQYQAISYDRSSGYRPNTDFSTLNAFVKGELCLDRNRFRFIGGYTDNRFGANSYYSDRFPDQYEEVKTFFFGLEQELHASDNVVIKPRLYYRRNDDRFLLVRDDPDFYRNTHRTDVLAGELHGSWKNRLGTAGFGAELRRETIASSNLGDHRRLNAGIFAEQRFSFLGDRMYFTPGIYVNWLSDHGWEAYPGLEAGFWAFDQYLLYASAGRSFRLPTYTDLFYRDPSNLGNPALRPESAWQYEVGVRRSGKGWRAEANVFYRDGRDLIDWIRTSESGPWQPVNFRRSTILGGEISATIAFPELLQRDRFFLQRLDLSYTAMDFRPDTTVEVSRYALSHLRHQLVAGIRHRIVGGLTNDLRLRVIERFGQTPYVLLDCRLAWTFPNGANLYLEGSNLFNTEYREIGTVPMPGIWARLGGSYRLDFNR